MTQVIAALIVFMLVILFHELGHFLVAKSRGIRVNEFSIGMGPALFQKKKKDTLYSIRALPLGGYCAMEGEEEASSAADSFDQASAGSRFLTILAGPMMNLLICYLCFALFFGIAGKPVPRIAGFSEPSALKEAGLMQGDTITAIDDKNIEDFEQLQRMIQKSDGEALKVTFLRDNASQDVTVRPIKSEQGTYVLGFLADRDRDASYALIGAFQEMVRLFGLLFVTIGRLLTGRLSLSAVSGPVGVVQAIGTAAQEGLSPLLFFTGYISLNLAFFNLLPIPALDGSKLLLIGIEKLTGKTLAKETEAKITMVGFFFLLALIALVSVKDIWALFR